MFRYVDGSGGAEAPVAGSVISIGTYTTGGDSWNGNPYGHVGVAQQITQTDGDHLTVTLFDQNYPLPSGRWKQVAFVRENGLWTGTMTNTVGAVTQTIRVSGWAVPGMATSRTVEVMLSGGGRTRVRDFLGDSGVRLIGANDRDGYYTVVGNPDEEITPSGGYRINYYLVDHSFGIYLDREPLGRVRRAAAADIASRLAVSSNQLCSLAIEVGTFDYVNASFGARSLGLPDCPGAVPLPGD